MAVQARFWVKSVEKQAAAGGGLLRNVVLQPVTRSTDDNVDWSQYTPVGEIKLMITKDGAGEWFEDRIGKDVAITFDDPE